MDDIVLIKYNSSGKELWVRSYNSLSNNNDVANSVSIDNSGNLILSGFITGTSSGSDLAVIKYSQLTDIIGNNEMIKDNIVLYQNYPNPFNPSSVISLQLGKPAAIEIKLYDVTGKFEREILNSFLIKGTHEVLLDGTDLPGGIYFYFLKTEGNFTDSKKCILLK